MTRRTVVAAALGAYPVAAGFARRARAAGGGRRFPPFPGQPSRWEGFERHDFDERGRPAVVVVPGEVAPGRPWLWRAEFFGAFAMVDRALLARGWHVAYLDCKNTFGSPETMRRWDGFYARLTSTHGLHRRPVLLGMSRGGLYAYAWAAHRPETVGLIYGDAPVCDVKSWPAGRGKGKGSPRDWKLFQQVFGLDEAQALLWKGNPIDVLAPIARANIPIIHVVGDADDVVPWPENTGILKQRYEKLGGHLELIVKPGVGHHPHGLPDPTPVVDYIVRNTRS
jgi:pimeloyl-ACP methyl ester carboxylesterase